MFDHQFLRHAVALLLVCIAVWLTPSFVVNDIKGASLVIRGDEGMNSELFWRKHKTAHLPRDTTAVPITFPGPADEWAGGEPKTIAIPLPSERPYRLTLSIADWHPSLPPVILVRRGGVEVIQWKLTLGTGVPEGGLEKHAKRGVYTVNLPAGPGEATLTSVAGSWLKIGAITVERPVQVTGYLIVAACFITAFMLMRTGIAATRPTTRRDRVILVLNLLSLLLLLIIPNGASNRFDGLPWSTPDETVTAVVALPGIALIGWRLLTYRATGYLVVALVAVKLAIGFVASEEGLNLKIYDTPDEMAVEQWRKTYDTFYHPGRSAVITGPITQGIALPLDWLWRRDSRFTIGHYPAPRIEPKPDQGPDWLAIKGDGFISLNKGEKVAWQGSGIKDGRVTCMSGNRPVVTPMINSFDSPDPGAFADECSGVASLSGTIVYHQPQGEDYRFDLLIASPNGTVSSAFKTGRIFSTRPGSIFAHAIARELSSWFDLLLVVLLAGWFLWGIAYLYERRDIDLFIITAGFAGFAAGLNSETGMFATLGMWARTGGLLVLAAAVMLPTCHALWIAGITGARRYISLGVALTASLTFAWLTCNDCGHGDWNVVGLGAMLVGAALVVHSNAVPVLDRSIYPMVMRLFVAVGPLIIGHYTMRWWGIFGLFEGFGPLSDRLTYQVFAREIFVEGDWLHSAGEGVFFYQPGYRYLVGFLHLLFGQSVFAQYFLDIWAIGVATAAVMAFLARAALPSGWLFAGATFYLVAMFAPHFSWLIGIGIIEITANLFLFGAMILFLQCQEKRRLALFVAATLISMIAFWARADRLGIIVSLVLLAIPFTRGGFEQEWRSLFVHLWREKGRLLIHFSAVGAALLAVMIRNFHTGGEFRLRWKNLEDIGCNTLYCVAEKYRLVLFGSPECIDRATFFLVGGVAIAFVALVFRPQPLQKIPVALPVIIAGLLSPYLLGGPNSYEPRFSVHLLPLAVMSVTLLFAGIGSAVKGDGQTHR